jgi:antitoxin VapB
MIELSPETEILARRLADARHLPVDAAVREALEASAQAAGVVPGLGPARDRSGVSVATRRERMDKIVREIASMPILDARSPEEIMDDLNAV